MKIFLAIFISWILPICVKSAVCGNNFGVTVCYGTKIVPLLRFCPDRILRVNSPRTTVDLSNCPAIDDTLTIIFEKECAVIINVTRPTTTLPPECAFVILPVEYRILVSCLIRLENF